MRKLRIAGTIEPEIKLEETRAEGQIRITSSKRIQVGAARTAAAPVEIDVNETDVVRMQLSDGFDLWIRADDLYKEFGVKTSRGIADPEAKLWEISPELLGEEDVERGKIVKGIQALEVFGVDLLGNTAKSLARWFEKKQLKHDRGLYRCPIGQDLALTAVSKGDLTGGKPVLVFIHGTASSTAGSFGKLWDRQNPEAQKARQQLAKVYGDQILAFEHYTMTESPIANALALANVLPKGAELHLVTHSRGGLVGELLCLAQRDLKNEYLTQLRIEELFKKKTDLGELMGFSGTGDVDYEQQRKDLLELLNILDTQSFRVKRFVRVACPARGSTLVSGRLDRWLSMLSHLAGENPWFEEPIDLLLAIVKEHTDPRSLPGLEAMMPGSPLVNMLNLPQIKVDSDLSVIAGDAEGKSLWGRLKLLVTDWFYSGDNDLVVNTGSMYGGLGRSGGARFFLDQGDKVNHFRYFVNDTTLRPLVAGLTRTDADAAGFKSIAEAQQEEPARAPVSVVVGPRPVAFIVPGIMGSHLKRNGDRLWLDIGDLAMGGLAKLSFGTPGITPDDVFEDYYRELTHYLRRTHEVIRFAYDWRESVLKNGEELARAITEKLPACEATNQPVHIVAHSMGGLVARAMIARSSEVWRRMCSLPGSRLLMLGTPNAGSHEIVRLLVGQSGTLIKLALIDVTHDRNELLQIINRFPGVLELLPTGDAMRCYATGFWSALQSDSGGTWPLPNESDLRSAAQTWQAIASAPVDSERMVYVAGCARRTPIGCEAASEPFFGTQVTRKFIRFFATRQGDGNVPWETGRLAGVRTWYLPDVEHGELAAAEAAFSAYLELLQTGKTTRLTDVPPVTQRAVEERFMLAPDVPDCLPDQRELTATVIGAPRRKKRAAARLPKVKLSIRHGSLAYARYPVCVGHYQGDTIVSAEAYLDSVLGGRLHKRHQLDLYPGRLGTMEVFFNSKPQAKPGGAIIIGLGLVGELSPGQLESAFGRAMLSYAVQVAEWPDDRFGTAQGVPRSARVCTLLIGTGSGSLSVRDSLESMLRGVKDANRRLQEIGLNEKVFIDALEFVELWQDVAIDATRQLQNALLDGELADHFIWEDGKLLEGEGGRRRVMFEEAPYWWHRLEITLDPKKEELRFIALTDRARAEETLVAGQMRLAEDFIRQAISQTAYNRDISRTLFEMLIPNRLKEMAPNQRDLVLVVDEVSGQFPWELLEDRWSASQRPLSVTAGALRQLKTADFREQPARTAADTAFVVGDPAAPPPGSEFSFPDLPGARAEAEAVGQFLTKRGFQVKCLLQAQADQILTGLHADGYRILHLAGHGVHQWPVDEEVQQPCPACQQMLPKTKKLISGMVIGNKVFLTAGDVEQMRWVPELVFINCCYLGRLDSSLSPYQRYNRFAANIAAQFIRMGVKAVVAAGWAVDDAAAKTFALSLYDHLLLGDAFGDAVRAARDATFTRHGQTNTWGAYQCYGDPAYRLKPKATPTTKEHLPSFVSSAQLTVELDNLASRARMGHGRLEDINPILARIPEAQKDVWLAQCEVASALGLAYGELGNFKDAIKYLDEAMKANKAWFPLRALEQRANFECRWAVSLAREGRNAKSKPARLIKKAVAELLRLNEFAATVERLSLLGSAYKRLAWISRGDERKEALKEMGSYYEKAHEQTYKGGKGRLDTYPVLNWLVAKTLRIVWYGGGRKAGLIDEVETWCRKAQALAAERELQDPDFWNSVVKPDCDLAIALARGSLKDDQQEILQGYVRAKQRGASQVQFGSVLEHVEFVKEMAAEAPRAKSMTAGVKALGDIVARLKGQLAETNA